MKTILFVGLGSFIGGILRYLFSYLLFRPSTTFPWGTLSINIIGCLLLGILTAYMEKNFISEPWRYFLASGILGGFTTYSAFSNESFALIKNANYTLAILYITLSISLGLIAAWGGYNIPK